jgi:peptide/nickel transport system permease protein
MSMGFLFVPLWTDLLLWLLVAAALAYGWRCSRKPHLAAPWVRVFRTRRAAITCVVLAGYVLVALMDSVHFRPRLERQEPGADTAYSGHVLSLLDLAERHLYEHTEKTYSAPFATRLFAKELVELPGGQTAREYPRLRYGGAYLANEADRGADIAWRGLLALLGAAALWGAAGLAFRPLVRRYPAVHWGVAWATLGLVLAVMVPLLALSNWYHVLGTDKVGQDVFYQTLKSFRTSLIIGTLTTLVLLPLGLGLGVMAGYFKGRVDDAIQYVYTTIHSIPSVLLIAAAVLMMQVYIDSHAALFPTTAQRADLRLLFLCVILGFTNWTGMARLLRGEALKLSELEFVQAAHAFGVSHRRILLHHLVPNVAHIVIISLVMDFSSLVLAEAVLSYVGVGVDPSTTSFGTMINTARLEMARDPMVWWSLASAFCFMFVLVLAANLFADAVRDGFDPRGRSA